MTETNLALSTAASARRTSWQWLWGRWWLQNSKL